MPISAELTRLNLGPHKDIERMKISPYFVATFLRNENELVIGKGKGIQIP